MHLEQLKTDSLAGLCPHFDEHRNKENPSQTKPSTPPTPPKKTPTKQNIIPNQPKTQPRALHLLAFRFLLYPAAETGSPKTWQRNKSHHEISFTTLKTVFASKTKIKAVNLGPLQGKLWAHAHYRSLGIHLVAAVNTGNKLFPTPVFLPIISVPSQAVEGPLAAFLSLLMGSWRRNLLMLINPWHQPHES